MASTTPVALLGTGLLGSAVATRLMNEGVTLRAWNRSAERLVPLAKQGARACPTAAEAWQGCRWVITLLSDGEACRQVLLTPDPQVWKGQAVLQMGTIAPTESREIAVELARRGADYLECPVLGSCPEALAGQLQIMAAGSETLFQEALRLLHLLGPNPRHLGPLGCALESKLALNQLIASLTHAFSLSMHLVQAAGIEVNSFMELLRGSALHAPTFDKKLARLLADDFAQPNFPTAHLRKDLALFLASAESHGLNTEGLRGLAELLARADGAELDRLDYSSLHRLTATAP